MRKKGFVRVALVLALFAGLAASASAQVTVSGGFALSSMKAEEAGYSMDGKVGFGGNIYLDYLLPVSVPLSLGLEAGFDTATINDLGIEITGRAIPLLLRAAYHFDLMTSLDLYLVGKIGYVFGSAEYGGDTESGYNGVGFGFDLGAAYYFTSRFGAFAEVGFDRYNVEKSFDMYTEKIRFTRFVTFGVSAKF